VGVRGVFVGVGGTGETVVWVWVGWGGVVGVSSVGEI
jgi:hypothetical protein